jgi:cysteinyl-tRNA synthetase
MPAGGDAAGRAFFTILPYRWTHELGEPDVRVARATTLIGAAIGALLMLVVTLEPALAQGSPGQRRNPLLEVDNWGYQLHSLDPHQIATNNHYDLLVVDYSRTGGDAGRFSKADVQRMKQRPSGRPRLVLCYLSIGEAENYRYYWRSQWRPGSPSWVVAENQRWRGNYQVKYWDPGWQGILMGEGASYLKRILEAGFDGIYLDRVDAYREAKDHADARREMLELVKELSRRARAANPGFLIVTQNPEDLLKDEELLRVIDGVGVEDLLFGQAGEGKRNSAEETKARAELLKRARQAGKGIFLVEYLNRRQDQDAARSELLAMETGFVPYVVAPRDLGRIKTEDLEAHDEPD